MVELLKDDPRYKCKGFTFIDEGMEICYNYYYSKSSHILKQIIRMHGNFIKLLQRYKLRDIHNYQ